MRKIAFLAAAFAAAAAPAAGAAEADGRTYWFGTHTKHTNVTFTSEADVENIYGMTNVASGTTWLDLVDGKGKASITIPVKHMTTQIALRDEHMRSDVWLDEARFPNITFEAEPFDVAAKNKEKGLHEAKVKGRLTVHGVAKELTATVRIAAVPAEKAEKILGKGDWVRVTTSFDVKLSEHGVKIPEGPVAGKVNDTWAIKFDCYATTEKGK
jgi:polyisoprenoid-binding protein YceI